MGMECWGASEPCKCRGSEIQAVQNLRKDCGNRIATARNPCACCGNVIANVENHADIVGNVVGIEPLFSPRSGTMCCPALSNVYHTDALTFRGRRLVLYYTASILLRCSHRTASFLSFDRFLYNMYSCATSAALFFCRCLSGFQLCVPQKGVSLHRGSTMTSNKTMRKLHRWGYRIL